MLTGTIKFFNKPKGFGFITSDAGGKEVFLPSATVTASGLKKVEPGLRVSFQEEADVKGPKAVALALLDEPRVVVAPKPVQPRAAAVTLYYDPQSPAFEIVQDALADHGVEVTLVDYTASPPPPDELKRWSLALIGSDAGLVRRSDPMFFALQLDDRFISENDFWLAVSQHPTLINGPFLKTHAKLAPCKTENDVRSFLGKAEAGTPSKPKGLSPRLSALIRGEALPPDEDDDEDDMEDEIEDAVIDTAPGEFAPKAGKDVAKPVKAKPAAKAAARKTVPAKKPAAKKR